MTSLVCKSYLHPVLLAKIPTELAKSCVSPLKESFEAEAPKNSLWTYQTAGFVQIRNRSVTKIECHGESIAPGMTALFACAFTPTDHSLARFSPYEAMSLKATLLLERTGNGCIVSVDRIHVREGCEQEITVMASDDALIADLLNQFRRYREEFKQNNDKDLFEQRRKLNLEFDKYSADPAKYTADLKKMNVLVSKTVSTFIDRIGQMT